MKSSLMKLNHVSTFSGKGQRQIINGKREQLDVRESGGNIKSDSI